METISELLRQASHKATPQRVAIARAVTESQECLTPAALYEKVRHIDPRIGLVTVYRTLDILSELRLVCEVHLPDGSHGYTGRPAYHHDHLICSGCGKVVNFPDCNISELEDRLSSETGFTIGEHHLEFYGKCRECQKVPATQRGVGLD